MHVNSTIKPGNNTPIWCGLILFLWLVFPLKVFSTGSYDFNVNCRKAYQLIFSYKIEEANVLLKKEVQNNPGNLIPDYLSSFGDLLETFYNDEPGRFSQFKKRQELRRARLEKGDAKSPYHRFCLAEVNLHTAMVLAKYDENFSAAYDVSKAYRLLTENAKKFPDFLPTQKDLLVLQAAVGTVPDSYKWALKIVGFSGELKPSLQKYEKLVDDLKKSREYGFYYAETGIIYAFMQHYLLNKPEAAWNLIDELTTDYKTNALSAYTRSAMAIRVKKNDELIKVLTPYTNTPPPMPYMDYMLGIAKLTRLETESGFFIGRFLKLYKGNNYIKDAYLKLGYSFLIKGDTESYKQCMNLISRYGGSMTEEDKNALKEAAKNKVPNITLLRARLLFDGGFFQRAQQELLQKGVTYFKTENEKAEYYYRLGRINEGLEKYDEAIDAFDVVIKNYSYLKEFFAPASALYGGIAWEKKGNTAKAKDYFNKCLSYDSYPFKDSFDQKAYSGLERLQ